MQRFLGNFMDFIWKPPYLFFYIISVVLIIHHRSISVNNFTYMLSNC